MANPVEGALPYAFNFLYFVDIFNIWAFLYSERGYSLL